MSASFIQTNIFSLDDSFKSFEDIFHQQKFKRVHYKKPKFKKIYKNDIVDSGFMKDDIASWGNLQQIYIKLANFFPILFENVEYKDFGKFRVWVDDYDKDLYKFKGQEFKGQKFKYITCEIIGSELLLVEQRLKLHSHVLDMLKNNIDMVDINKYIEEFLNGQSI